MTTDKCFQVIIRQAGTTGPETVAETFFCDTKEEGRPLLAAARKRYENGIITVDGQRHEIEVQIFDRRAY